MPSNMINIWFDDASVTKVVVYMMVRRKMKTAVAAAVGGAAARPPLAYKTNAHRLVRVKEAVPADPKQAPSEENPWAAVFELAGVAADHKVVFHTVGLNAVGKVVVTAGVAAK